MAQEQNLPIESDSCYFGVLCILTLIWPEPVLNIEEVIGATFKGDRGVVIDTMTLENLLVFKEEVHPSMIKGKGRSKEDFSLFSTIGKMCCSAKGKKMLEGVLRAPTRRVKVLLYRQGMIKSIQWMDLGARDAVRRSLRKGSSFGGFLGKLSNVKCDIGDWKKLVSTATGVMDIIDVLKGTNFCAKLVRKLIVVRPVLELICSYLQRTLDFNYDSNSHMDQSYFMIKIGVDDKLDE